MVRLAALLLVLFQAVPPATLPAAAASQLRQSLAAAMPHGQHVWRDVLPVNDDKTVNAYIEIPRGERRKFEFDIARHERRVDREMPQTLGGYPVNYGFAPQTVSYDGDPFDIMMLGPPLRGGTVVRGVIVGIMHMEDEKGVDSKVVLSSRDRYGRATQPIRAADQRRMTEYFNHYKDHEPGKFSRVTGWGGVGEARAFLSRAHAFFRECAQRPEGDCEVYLPAQSR